MRIDSFISKIMIKQATCGVGTVFLQMGGLTNRTRGNKSKEFESLSLTTKIGTKQLSVTLLNSVITLKLIIWVKKKKNVR